MREGRPTYVTNICDFLNLNFIDYITKTNLLKSNEDFSKIISVLSETGMTLLPRKPKKSTLQFLTSCLFRVAGHIWSRPLCHIF